MAVYDDLIKVRRGTAAQWASKNPILAAGEIGLELGALNDQQFKIGDGASHYLSLPYYQNAVQIQDIIDTLNAEGVPGPPGDSAYEVAVDNGFVGTEAQWLASLEGADGAKGDKGDQGNQGIQGNPGTPGTNGTNGTDGADGADGDSAYQVAVNNGFVGTEAAWLASLEGPQGPAGADGDSSANFPFADHYGFVAAVGDPMVFTTNGTLGPNTLFISRIYIPAGKTLTSLWCLVNSAGSHDGTSVENKIGYWEDNGVLAGQTPDDPTIWTGGVGWRGGAMLSPIASQGSPRFGYIGVLVHGMSGLNVAYRVAGDTSGVQIGPATTKRRQILNGSPSAGLPTSFDPTSYSSITGYCPMMAIT